MPETVPPVTYEPSPQEPAGVPAPPRFTARDIFVGPDGLRAGWSILVFAALFLALLAAAGFLLHEIQNHSHHTAAQTSQPALPDAAMSPENVLVQEGVPLLCALLATWIMARLERRPISVYGFDRQRRLRNFLAGLAWGVTLLSLLIVILRGAGLLVFDARLLFGADTLRYGAIWFAGFLFVGLLEEILTRGYLQFTLTRGLGGTYRRLFGAEHANAIGFWSAALMLSFAFGFLHRTNPGESPIGELSAGLIGLTFCFSLWRTGSLWWAIGFHAAWDWGESFLYGVADSGGLVQHRLFACHPVGRPILTGGLTGPEGSIFVLPVIALAAIVIVATLPRARSAPTSANPSPPALH